MENLARYVGKVEKTRVELIIRAHLLERITQVANTGGVIDVQSPLAHHLLQVSVAERIPQVPADTQQNNLGLEVTPFERGGGMHEIGSTQFLEYRRVYCILALFATQPVSPTP